MRLTNKNILIVSPEPWNHIFVSKHHYAIHLAERNNTVYFLNPPDKFEKIEPTEYANVFSVHYKKFFPGLRYFPSFIQKYLMRMKFNHLEKLCAVNFDIIWSFDNSVFFDFSSLSNNVFKISHIVDLNQNFEFKKAARSADVCFGVSAVLVEKLRQYNCNTYFINHGFKSPDQNVNFNLRKHVTRGLKVGYTGNLDLKYIDWTILMAAINLNPDVFFYFAGPFDSESDHIRFLKNQSNVILLGKIKSSEIASFLNQMDILVLCYRINEYPDQLTNSHKFMEYLGSGKPIVATYTEEYAKHSDCVLMAEHSSEWIDLFQYACQNIDQLMTADLVEKRKEIAFKNTYEKQIEKIENLLCGAI